MNLNDNSTIPVTDEQVKLFQEWVKHTYGTYRVYQSACYEGPTAITEYFLLNIMSTEMANAFDDSEPYVGLVSDDPHINQLQLYRRRIAVKISRTNLELMGRAFPVEFEEYNGEETEDDKLSLKYWRHQNALFHEHLLADNYKIPRNIVQLQLAPEVVNLIMNRDCGICLLRHKMTDTCVTNCGHEFGTKCLTSWSPNTCPICSDICREVTVFTA
jgi:hypothetical protein